MPTLERIESGKNFVLFNSEGQKVIKIENVRFSYPYFGKQREEEDDNGNPQLSWGGVAMLPKTTHLEAKNAFVAIMDELLAAEKIKIEPQYKPIKNGDDKDDEDMAGHWLISFSEKGRYRPAVRTISNEVVSDPDEIDEMFYGGCWGSVLLRPWYFNGKSKKSKKTYPKRICCGYTGVQFLKDDKPFGGGRIDDSEAWGSAGSDDSKSDGLDDDNDGL